MSTPKKRKKGATKGRKTRARFQQTSSGPFRSEVEKEVSNSWRRITWMPAGRDFRPPFGYKRPLRIEVSKELQWLLPFLERTHQVLPRLQMPVRINGYKPAKTKKMRTLGTSYYDEGVINLVTHRKVYKRDPDTGKKVVKLRRFPKSKILETLAHELAHLHVAEHNFEHAEMTKTIFRTFGLSKECPYCNGAGKVEMDCDPF